MSNDRYAILAKGKVLTFRLANTRFSGGLGVLH